MIAMEREGRCGLLFLLLTALALFSCFLGGVVGMEANPNPESVELEDGEVVLQGHGGPFEHWYTTADGYTVMFDPDIGKFVYAEELNGTLVSSGCVLVRTGPVPRNARKNARPKIDPNVFAQLAQERSASEARFKSVFRATKGHGSFDVGNETRSVQAIDGIGVVKNLVLLIKFSDTDETTLRPRRDYEVLFNSETPDEELCPTGSVRDFYSKNSYHEFTLESVVTDWIEVSYTRESAAGSCSGMACSNTLRDAIIEALDTLARTENFDFSQFDRNDDKYIDSFTVIQSSYGAENGGSLSYGYIWSHKWQLRNAWVDPVTGIKVEDYNVNPAFHGSYGNRITRIGVLCHEIGHYFGLPDLYDTEYPGYGIGVFGVMGSSWGVYADQLYPPSFSAWSKVKLGFVNPVILNESGTYSLRAVQRHKDIFMINNGYRTDEYLLLENRDGVDFDYPFGSYGGIVIYHVDDKVSNNDYESYPGHPHWPSWHYKVAVIQADGLYGLEKGYSRSYHRDVWSSRYFDSKILGDFTVPDLNSYDMVTNECSFTGNVLGEWSAPGATMSFRYEKGTPVLNDCSIPRPTGLSSTDPGPAAAPTQRPTTKPPSHQPAPTSKPTAEVDSGNVDNDSKDRQDDETRDFSPFVVVMVFTTVSVFSIAVLRLRPDFVQFTSR